MAKIQFQEKNFRKASRDLIDKANLVVEEYQAMGEMMTIRQLYYQFVARGWIPNSIQSYDNIQNLISEARLAGLIDWDAIEDRTRELEENTHWESPSHIIGAVERSYMLDRWEGQKNRVEVWVEKAALAGVMLRVCRELDCPFFACRGYTSQSEMYTAGVRLARYSENGQAPIILHFGDHDPSGIDMSRDIESRLVMFMGVHGHFLQFERIALNMDQINKYKPPPYPAKVTDVRYEAYRRKYGDDSWELDSLAPPVLSALIRDNVARYVEPKKMKAVIREEETGKELLGKCSANWEDVASYLDNF